MYSSHDNSRTLGPAAASLAAFALLVVPGPGTSVAAPSMERAETAIQPQEREQQRARHRVWRSREPVVRGHLPGAVFKWRTLGGGYIGVDVLPLSSELRVHFGVAEDAGVLVSSLEAGGPGESAGLRVGDILTHVDSELVTDPSRLARAIRQKEAGESVTLELWRDGSIQSVPVVVAERERPVFDFATMRLMPGQPGQIDELEGDVHGYTYVTPGLELDAETLGAFENAMKELGGRFERGEWREKLDKLQELDFGSIQERMQEVEKRLRELERELAKEREPGF